MSARALVDPELLPLLDLLQLPVFSDAQIGEIRAALAGMRDATERSAPPPQDYRAEGFEGEPAVRMRVHGAAAPGGAPRAALLYIHGGGFVLGTADAVDDEAAAWAAAIDGVVVAVDYRLAPETRYPGALHDCYAALRWMHAKAAEFGIDSARIAVLGDSAGGALAASLALFARDRGDAPIAFQLLGMPMLDDRTAQADADPALSKSFVWQEHHNRYGWTRYLGGATPGEDGYAAAGRATDLRGLPPAFISVGALDLFLEEDLAYAARLIAADVPTELHVYPGAVHAFEMMPGTAVGARYRADRLAAMLAGLAPRR